MNKYYVQKNFKSKETLYLTKTNEWSPNFKDARIFDFSEYDDKHRHSDGLWYLIQLVFVAR